MLKENFEARVEKITETGCWIWVGAQNNQGYGVFRYRGKLHLSHRYSWILYKGEITGGLQVLHQCDISSCCNPAHLFLGTQKYNMQDMNKKGRRVDNQAKGEQHNQAKLTEEQVRLIRDMPGKQRSIAREFGVSQTTVWFIKSGKHWGHVK